MSSLPRSYILITALICMLPLTLSAKRAYGTQGKGPAVWLLQDTSWQKLVRQNFELAFPSSWQLDTSNLMGTTLIIFSPLEHDGDDFSENVNLIIQDLGSNPISLEAYVELSDQQIKQLAHKETPFVSQRLQKNNQDYHRFRYKLQSGPHLLQIETYAWVKQTQAFVLTFSYKEESNHTYVARGKRILNSFKLN